MQFIWGFLTGMAVMGCMFVGYGYYMLKKIKGTLEKQVETKKDLLRGLKDRLAEQDNKQASIISRLKQAQAITEQQLDIRDAADQPSKNALHSRYKNGLVGDMKKLEEEKMAILRSILDDGFDPLISVRSEDGTLQELPLSHFVDTSAAKKSSAEEPKKRLNKFVVLKGGKDDETVH